MILEKGYIMGRLGFLMKRWFEDKKFAMDFACLLVIQDEEHKVFLFVILTLKFRTQLL